MVKRYRPPQRTALTKPAPISIDRALVDKHLLGAALSDFDLCTWRPALKAAFGLKLNDEEAKTFAVIAGNRTVPESRVRELWAVVGRRGGKSRMAAAVAIYLALFVKHRRSPGERLMVLVLAASIEQARTVFSYVKGFIDASAMLRKEVAVAKAFEVTFSNGVTVAVHSSSFRTARGRSLIACIMDECAFFRDETSANPDVETYRAVLPAMSTTNGMLIGISTPYRKIGLVHQKHRDHFGQDSADILVVQGSTQLFNPTLSDDTIAAQRLADPTAAPSEWDAEFRDDISSYLDDQLIDAAVEYARPLEIPPVRDSYRLYRSFCDASGGTGHDSYTVCIAHKEKEAFVVDVVRGTVGKFDPGEVTAQYAALLKEYGVSSVTGDNYAAEWVAQAWRNTGVNYERSDIPKSQIYLNCIPLFTRGLVRLPDHAKLLRELRLLERQTHRGGKESVDHPRSGHDDLANSVCGALHSLSVRLGYDYQYRGFRTVPDAPNGQPATADQRLHSLYAGIANAIRCHPMTRPTSILVELGRDLIATVAVLVVVYCAAALVVNGILR
jgi:hypothetical protein